MTINPPYQTDERYSRRLPVLAEAQNWRCCYCGQRCVGQANEYNAPTTEHVIPLIRGGLRIWQNEVMACAHCNRSRGAINAHHFAKKVRKLGRKKACKWARDLRTRTRLAHELAEASEVVAAP